MKQRDFKQNREKRTYEKRTLPVRRVAKVTKGGKKLRFSTVVVVGDRNGKVGVALGRGADVRTSVQQGERLAERSVVKVELIGDTIPHEIVHKYGASKVLLRPARPGTGVIAGSSVRVVLELAGVENVYGKILGSSDANSNAYCTFEALKLLRKGRVLQRMSKMRERVAMKEETDKERKIKEEKRRKKEIAEKKRARQAARPGRKEKKAVKVTKKTEKKEVKKDNVSEEK